MFRGVEFGRCMRACMVLPAVVTEGGITVASPQTARCGLIAMTTPVGGGALDGGVSLGVRILKLWRQVSYHCSVRWVSWVGVSVRTMMSGVWRAIRSLMSAAVCFRPLTFASRMERVERWVGGWGGGGGGRGGGMFRWVAVRLG